MNVCSFVFRNLIAFPQFHSTFFQLYPFTCITRSYRKIQATEEGNVVTIEGISHSEDGIEEAVRLVPEDPCPLRSRGIQITPEDVLILNQFVTSSGDILTREETGLCEREYYKVIACVKMAQRSNMLHGPENNTSVTPNGTKLNSYLTRYPIGTRSPIKGRNLWYRRNYYKVGDRRLIEDAPKVARKRLIDKH